MQIEGTIMIDDKTIRLFCAIDNSRPKLTNPFNQGSYTFAANGHIAIKISRREEYDKNAPIDQKMEILFTFSEISETLWIDIPDLDKIIEYQTCPECKGEKIIKVCRECHGKGEVFFENDYNEYYIECKSCDGFPHNPTECEKCSGTGQVKKNRYILIGSKALDTDFLSTIKLLPGVKIAPEAVEGLNPIPFKFENGEGIIMPCRKEYLDL
jgi:hypothetical protein